MSTTTTILGLTKPAYTDAADIAVLNTNSDLLDTILGTQHNTDGTHKPITLTNALNSISLDLNSSATTAICVDIDSSATTGNVLDINCGALTTAAMIYLYSNSGDASSRNLLNIIAGAGAGERAIGITHGNASAAVLIAESSTGLALDINKASTGTAVDITVTGGAGGLTVQGGTTKLADNKAMVLIYDGVVIQNGSNVGMLDIAVAGAGTCYGVRITNAGTGPSNIFNNTNNATHMRLTGDPIVASPVDGDLWFTGSSLNFRNGAVTKDLLIADFTEIFNTAGDLKIAPDVQGDVVLFGDTDISAGTDGKSLYIHRKAAAGDASIRLYVNEYGNSKAAATNDFEFEGDSISFYPSGSIVLFGRNWDSGQNDTFRYFGYITADTANKYVQFQVNDTTDNFELTREDAFVLGLDIQMPLITDNITVGGSFFPKQVTDAGPMTATNGTEGEIVYNLSDNKFYGCTATGTPATWAAFN